jgi:nucleoside-diphosphate-sugar epimerase
MYSAMRAHAGFDELETGTGAQTFDAVVHFAAIPRLLIAPDTETWRVNVVGTYNVIEAAVKMGVRKIVIASSETTYGVCFSDGRVLPKVLPLEEDYDIDPMDSYGLSKKVNEVTGRGFQRRSGADIYALRIGNVIEPHEYARDFPGYFANPDLRLRIAFSYIDARDLGQIVDRCLAADGLGFQVFNAANDGHSVHLTTDVLIERYYRQVPLSRPMGAREGFLSNRKIREVLGFREEHPWTRYVTAPEG